jgi:hypothetical protein
VIPSAKGTLASVNMSNGASSVASASTSAFQYRFVRVLRAGEDNVGNRMRPNASNASAVAKEGAIYQEGIEELLTLASVVPTLFDEIANFKNVERDLSTTSLDYHAVSSASKLKKASANAQQEKEPRWLSTSLGPDRCLVVESAR